MKILFSLLLIFTILTVGANSHCYVKTVSRQMNCRQLVFKQDEPLNITRPFGIEYVKIKDSSGFLSTRTLSSLSFASRLYLLNNNFTHVEEEALCSLPNLRLLELRGNENLPVITEAFLANCTKLEALYAHDVQMELSSVKRMTNLKELAISGQRISRLTKDYLQPLQNLNTLEIWRSEIEEIEPGALCMSPDLKVLRIQVNKVLPPLTRSVFENCSSVEEFSLRWNENLTVQEGALSGFNSLRVVQIDEINISNLTGPFLNGLQSAQKLEIVNSNISKISKDAFDSFGNLRSLSLIGNEISEIEPGALRYLPKLSQLDLSANKLTSIDNLEHPNLEELYVPANVIASINIAGIMTNLPKLKYLQIEYNSISVEYRRKE